MPLTAERLMRSRYTAYCKGKIDYIFETHHPEGREDLSREDTEEWAKNSEWLGLEIRKTSQGKESDTQGTVEFIARYRNPERRIKHSYPP